jgi:prepilin-type N-terminal cleavage/methylation domain-containing protein
MTRRAFTLLEGLVALSILSVVLVVSVVTFSLGKRDRAGWGDRVDDVYALIQGMERMRREIEVSRLVAAPIESFEDDDQREFLVTIDATGRPVVYSVDGGTLVAESPGEPKRVVLPRLDRVIFSLRPDCASVRFQVFLGGLSLTASVPASNDLAADSFRFGDTYGL